MVQTIEDMSKIESPQPPRRTTRSSFSTTTPVKNAAETNQCPLTLANLVYRGETITLDKLLSSFPGRRIQILQFLGLIGPTNSPMLPIFLYGGASTGKTVITLQILKHLKRPFVYVSCRTCYSPRILFELILNQVMLHKKSGLNGYSSAKRCEKPSDFITFVRESLVNIIDDLKGSSRKSSSKKLFKQEDNGNMIYLIFDNLELIRNWDKSAYILPLLFNLYDILKIPEVGFVFISNTSPDTYYSNTGYLEPIPLHFPDYTEDHLRQIFMRHQANPKLFSSFLDVVLGPFCRITRRVDELSTTFLYLFKKYCEPLKDSGIVPNEETKRRLYSFLKPHIASSLNEIFRVPSEPSLEKGNKEKVKRKSKSSNLVDCEKIDEIDFHMSTSAKYLLISAFLASRNPATLDASLFDSLGGADNRKRKRKSSEKSIERKETAEQESLMKGPGTFPLERLIAIFQCITSVAEGLLDDQQQQEEEKSELEATGLMSDVLLQLSSLCNANFITKGGSCPLEGSTRYRSTVSEDLALKVARSLKFPLSKYLYRR